MPDGRTVVRTGGGAGATNGYTASDTPAPASAGGVMPADRTGAIAPRQPAPISSYYDESEWTAGLDIGFASMSLDLSTIGGPSVDGETLSFQRVSYIYDGSRGSSIGWTVRGEFARTTEGPQQEDEFTGEPIDDGITWDAKFATPFMVEIRLWGEPTWSLWMGLGATSVEHHYADAGGDTRIAYSGVTFEVLRFHYGDTESAFGIVFEIIMPSELEFTSTHVSGWQPALDEFEDPSVTAMHWRMWYAVALTSSIKLTAAIDATLFSIDMTDSSDPVVVLAEGEEFTTYAAGGRASFTLGLTIGF
jgi:hypothetical protein